MSGERSSSDLPIRKLPYTLLRQLGILLDHPDDDTKNWKALIAAMPDGTYTQDEIEQFETVGTQTGGSSSEALLQDMGFRFKTVKQLISYLETIKQYAALELLKPEVIENHREKESVSGRTRGMQASQSFKPLVSKVLTEDSPVKDAPSSAGYQASNTSIYSDNIIIDSAGKSFKLPNGFSLEFPPDAVSHITEVSYKVCETFQPSPEENDTETIVSDILVLEPSHVTLHKPINISLVHSGPEKSDQGFESVLKLFNRDKNQWEEDCIMPSSKIQLGKLTAIAVVSRLVTDEFEVPVTGCFVRSSVLRDVTLHFPERAVDKPMKGSIKVIPMPSNVHEMTNDYPSPVIIVDGFDGYSFVNHVTIKLPHPCPAKYPVESVRLMCFKQNKWREISKDKDVQCTESKSTIELHVKHFSRLWVRLKKIQESFIELYKYLCHSPRMVYFAAFLRETDLRLARNPKIIFFCVANGQQSYISKRDNDYIELAGDTSLKPMRPSEKAYLKIGYREEIWPNFYLEFIKGEPCRRELHLNPSERIDVNQYLELSFYKEKNMETLVSQLRIEKHLIFRDNVTGSPAAGHEQTHGHDQRIPNIKDLHDSTTALDVFSKCLDPQFKNIKNWEHFAHTLNVPQNVIRTCKLYLEHSPTIRVFEYLDATNPELNIGELRVVLTRNPHRARHDIKAMLKDFVSEDKVSEVITNSTSVILDEIALKLDSATKPTCGWNEFGLELGIKPKKLRQFKMYTNYNQTEALFRYLYASSAKNVKLSVIVKYLDQMKRGDVLVEVRNVTQSTDIDAKDVLKLGSKLLDIISDMLNDDKPGVEGWRELARHLQNDHFKDDPEIISKLEPPRQHEIHSPTKKIIEWLAAVKPETKLYEILGACEKIYRNDAGKILIEYFPKASVIENLRENAKEPVSGQTSGIQANPSMDQLENLVHEVKI